MTGLNLKSILMVLTFLFAREILADNTLNVVPLANKNIDYKAKINSYDVRLVQENKKYKCKNYIDLVKLKQNKYFAQHYIAKDRVICAENVFIPESNTIRFKFGNLEIEREGTIVKETDEYIRIKNLDGTIDKIYKDGRN